MHSLSSQWGAGGGGAPDRRRQAATSGLQEVRDRTLAARVQRDSAPQRAVGYRLPAPAACSAHPRAAINAALDYQ